MIDTNFFDNSERIIINKSSEGTPISSFTRKRFMDNLSFQQNVCADEAINDLLEGLHSKIDRMTDEEWDFLRLQIPLPVYADADEEESAAV